MVDAEIRKDSWWETLGISVEDITKLLQESERDEKYLKDLANKTASNKSRHFIIVRSIVLDAQITLDYHLSHLIGLMLIFRGQHYGKAYDRKEIAEFIDYIHETIDYAKKVSIIEKLKILDREVITILFRINDLRKAFAHGKKNAKYMYNNKSIFDKATIDKLVSDKDNVIGGILSLIFERDMNPVRFISKKQR